MTQNEMAKIIGLEQESKGVEIDTYKGVELTKLHSTHPYWSNYVKLRIIRDVEREQQQLQEISKHPFLKKYYFGDLIPLKDILEKHRKQFKKIIGAYDTLGHRATTPCGNLL